MNPFPTLFAVLAASVLATAQCAFGVVSVATAGAGCSPVVGSATPPLAATFDMPACQLALQVGILIGTPQQQPFGRILVLGASVAALPLPQIGAGCVLVPSPDVVVVQDVFASPYRIQLPTVPLPPTTIHAQGAVLYFTPGPSSPLVSVSEALQVTLR